MTNTDRIVELGDTLSVLSKRDTEENAMAEFQFTLFKTGLNRRTLPWCIVDLVELATLRWEWWFNNHYSHSDRSYRNSAESEEGHYVG